MAGQLLRKLLVRRDYSRAFKLYSCLAMYKNRSEQLVWKVGAEILMHKKDYEPLCLRFLQLIFVKSTYCKEAILVETALYQLRCGMIEDAHTTLEPYIALHPYRDNALLQGYAGVIEFALWLKAVRRKLWQQQNKKDAGAACDEDSSDNGLEYDYWLDDNIEDANEATPWDARISRHAREALMQLERSLELDCRNDMFMVYIVQLKCGRIDMTGLGSKKISWSRKAAIHETKNYLKRYCNKNNDSILALHLLAALENREKQQTLELIVERDPAADSELYVLPLLELLRQSNSNSGGT
ncbi:hypothetical protein BGZ99_002564 [Dissophora globulifera]|uniref:Uncharacterized protein n=1 Tax=Dissophora globulifera TaxID=979702 RepID=A0A9P6RQC8_9FUNG|nr:hypothetical protein BGZ99_002564 [Dissophora globulifera]